MDKLDLLFQEHYPYICTWLRKRFRCSLQQAEDTAMESFYLFTKAQKKGITHSGNIRGYLVTVARNCYLQNQRLPAYDFLDTNKLVNLLEKRAKDTYREDPKDEDQSRLNLIEGLFNSLSKACKKILEGIYLEGYDLEELKEILGYSSYGAIKSTKSRCIKWAREKSKNNTT